MVDYIFVSITQLQEHVHGLGNFEPPEKWICPRCNANNFGIYHSHSSRCSECKEFAVPPIRTPLLIFGQDPFGLSIAVKDLTQQMEEWKNQIRRLEEQIGELEGEIDELDSFIWANKEKQKLLEKVVT